MAVVGGAGQIATNGLVWCLDFANPLSYPRSGTSATDLSGNGNTGTLTNSPTFSTSNSGILNFDGTNQFVTAGNVLNLNGSDMSLGVWFKVNATPSNFYPIVDKFTSGGYRLNVYDTLRLEFQYRDASNNIEQFGFYTIPPSISVSAWNYVVVTHQNSNNAGVLYLNGQQTNSVTFTRTRAASTTDLKLGYSANNIVYLNGSVAHVTIHNTILTPAQVLQNYNALRGRFGV